MSPRTASAVTPRRDSRRRDGDRPSRVVRGTTKIAAATDAIPAQPRWRGRGRRRKTLSCVASTRPTADPATPRDQEEPTRGATHLGGEQFGVEGAQGESRARGGDDRHDGCEPEQPPRRSARKNAAWNPVATSSPMIVTGRRPRLSASRLARSTPMMPGHTGGDGRGTTATSALVKSCAWVRYRLVRL